MGQIEPGQNAINVPDDPLDLIETFGPMSGMHAAMAARRIGMPCGLVACFQETEGDRVATAIEKAKRAHSSDRDQSFQAMVITVSMGS
ncbi:MAG: hypothetical protein WBF58_10665 [Xanthobacteraceae bacterium]